jgi:hypothetical protein
MRDVRPDEGITADEAERLLGGRDGDPALRHLLDAAAAPARGATPEGERTALAAFRVAWADPPATTRARRRSRMVLVRTAIAGLTVAATASGGVAIAAAGLGSSGSGTPPTTDQGPGPQVAPPSAGGTASPRSGIATPSEGHAVDGAAIVTQCLDRAACPSPGTGKAGSSGDDPPAPVSAAGSPSAEAQARRAETPAGLKQPKAGRKDSPDER